MPFAPSLAAPCEAAADGSEARDHGEEEVVRAKILPLFNLGPERFFGRKRAQKQRILDSLSILEVFLPVQALEHGLLGGEVLIAGDYEDGQACQRSEQSADLRQVVREVFLGPFVRHGLLALLQEEVEVGNFGFIFPG